MPIMEGAINIAHSFAHVSDYAHALIREAYEAQEKDPLKGDDAPQGDALKVTWKAKEVELFDQIAFTNSLYFAAATQAVATAAFYKLGAAFACIASLSVTVAVVATIIFVKSPLINKIAAECAHLIRDQEPSPKTIIESYKKFN